MTKRTRDQVIGLLQRRLEMRTATETHIPVPVDWIRDLVAEPSEPPPYPQDQTEPKDITSKPKRRRRTTKPAE